MDQGELADQIAESLSATLLPLAADSHPMPHDAATFEHVELAGALARVRTLAVPVFQDLMTGTAVSSERWIMLIRALSQAERLCNREIGSPLIIDTQP